ncbi:MAG: hypothetical protein J3T61_00530 [Candidatus Brocadiales bacterium]|nr:hypothetical protein [Candidatus Bathyanammoxibius sp.]
MSLGMDKVSGYIERLGAPVRNTGTNLVFYCPFHNDSRTPNMYVQIEGDWAGTFKCFACGRGGGIREFLEGLESIGFDGPSHRNVGLIEVPSPPPPRPCGITHEQDLFPESMIEWLYNRGIRVADALRYKLGYALYDNRYSAVAISYDEHYKLRFYEPDAKVKWLLYPGYNNKDLYIPDPGAFQVANFVLLCEGELDAVRANIVGFVTASLPNGVGGWLYAWGPPFEGKRVAICLDADEPGRRASESIFASLAGLTPGPASVGIVSLPELNGPGTDLTDVLNHPDYGEEAVRSLIGGVV